MAAFAASSWMRLLRGHRRNGCCDAVRQRSAPTVISKRLVLSADVSQDAAGAGGMNTSTEDTFAINAGRDLFFPGMDEDAAIAILDAELGSLEARDDRFIAAERLKFFPSVKAVDAIIRFVSAFDVQNMDRYILEDLVARRKAVESLGRHKGAFRRANVLELLRKCLSDPDRYMVEVAVWALAEIGITEDDNILDDIMGVLQNDTVEKRVVIQTLMRASYKPALESIKSLIDCPNQAVASAAMTAVAVLSKDPNAMAPVVTVLKSQNLNVRRAAIEDITLSKHTSALQQVAVCPNSLVLRARTVRVLLDAMRQESSTLTDEIDIDKVKLVDRLIWDHPNDLDLLGQKKETRKARDPGRNIRQLYKSDAIHAYAASKCLAEDYRNSQSRQIGADVIASYNDLGYFDYFGAYHVYKTLGWLRYEAAYDLLIENLLCLPPRFFNHQAGAATALAELGRPEAIPLLHQVAEKSSIWELKYACMISAEKLGDNGKLRSMMCKDSDWLIRTRARCTLSFDHLRSSFEA